MMVGYFNDKTDRNRPLSWRRIGEAVSFWREAVGCFTFLGSSSLLLSWQILASVICHLLPSSVLLNFCSLHWQRRSSQ